MASVAKASIKPGELCAWRSASQGSSPVTALAAAPSRKQAAKHRAPSRVPAWPKKATYHAAPG